MTLLELIIIVFVSSAVMHADRHRMHRLVASDSALMEQMRRSWLSDLEKSWGPTRSQNILLPSPSVTPNSTDVGWSWMPLCFLSLVSLVLMGATFLLMIMRLRKNVRDLRVRLATADATHHQSERDLKSRDARIKDLQSSLDRTNHDLEYRNSALEDLQRRLDQTNGDLETRNSTISGLQVTIHNERASTNSHLAFLFIFFVFLLRNLPTTYLSTIVRLRKNVHDLQVSLADVGDVQTHLDQRDRDLKSRDSALRDLQARFDKSERDLESRESTIKDLEATIDDGRTANLTLQSQNERAMMTIANLTKEIELAREREKVYAVEVNDFQQKLTESVEACAATESVALAAEEMVVQGMTGSDSRPTEAQPPEDVTKADASGTLVEESDEGKGSKEEGEEKSSRKRHHRLERATIALFSVFKQLTTYLGGNGRGRRAKRKTMSVSSGSQLSLSTSFLINWFSVLVPEFSPRGLPGTPTAKQRRYFCPFLFPVHLTDIR